MGLLAVVVSACGGNDSSTMSNYPQDLGRHVDALQTEQSAHSSEIVAAPDLDSIMRAEDEHWQRMNDHMNQMGMVMGQMMSCVDGRGARCDTAPFAGTMHDLRSDCDDHRAAVRSAATLDAARTEESRHQDVTHDRLLEMRGQMGTMVGSGISCPGM
jgi:outer membrane murein-binding lipoprotein Lpp